MLKHTSIFNQMERDLVNDRWRADTWAHREFRTFMKFFWVMAGVSIPIGIGFFLIILHFVAKYW